MSDRLRVGIVGCGAIATGRHIPAFLRLKNGATIQAVCDRDPECAGDAASRCRIPRVYDDISRMLAGEKLDIVDICTPPGTHAALTLQAIDSGCHVLLEKPMALTSADCDAMVGAATKRGVKLCVLHNQLLYPPVVVARKLVADGAIGRFIGMRIYMSDPYDEMVGRRDYWVHKLPGGLLGETGPHAVYRSLPFIGRVTDVEVQARTFREYDWAPFDEFHILLEGENGASSITISYPSNRRASTMDLYGMEGSLHLDLLSMLLIKKGRNDSMKPLALAGYSLGVAGQIIGGVARNTFNVLTGRARFGHDVAIAGFVDSIRNGHEPPVTGEEGRETIRVMAMIVARLKERDGRKETITDGGKAQR